MLDSFKGIVTRIEQLESEEESIAVDKELRDLYKKLREMGYTWDCRSHEWIIDEY